MNSICCIVLNKYPCDFDVKVDKFLETIEDEYNFHSTCAGDGVILYAYYTEDYDKYLKFIKKTAEELECSYAIEKIFQSHV